MVSRDWRDHWKEHLSRRKRQEILRQEWDLNFHLKHCNQIGEPKVPMIATVWVTGSYHHGVFWWSIDDETPHLYLLGDLSLPEKEYISHQEWDVIFLGTIAELKDTTLASVMEKLPSGENERVAILAVNKPMHGFDGRDLTQSVFPTPVINIIGLDKKRHIPRSYVHERWRPAAESYFNLSQGYLNDRRFMQS